VAHSQNAQPWILEFLQTDPIVAAVLQWVQALEADGIRVRPMLISTKFCFFHDLGGAIDEPMILARTDGNAQVLASLLQRQKSAASSEQFCSASGVYLSAKSRACWLASLAQV
jgi:hypothetical protein